MKRRLFTILSALSLLLSVAVVVLWVLSYHRHSQFWWYSDIGDRFDLISTQGSVSWRWDAYTKYTRGYRPPQVLGDDVHWQWVGGSLGELHAG